MAEFARRPEPTDRKRHGNLRRYLTLLRQYERTYDLYSITPEELLDLLPTEFDGFRSGSGNGGRPGAEVMAGRSGGSGT